MDATKLVDKLSVEEVVVWAGLLQIEYDYSPTTDDDYPDKEDALRVALADAMNMKLFGVSLKTPEEELPSGIRLHLEALVCEAMLSTLYTVRITPAAIAYDNFFTGRVFEKDPDEKYRQQISDYCCKCFVKWQQKIVQLLKEGSVHIWKRK